MWPNPQDPYKVFALKIQQENLFASFFFVSFSISLLRLLVEGI